MIHPFGEGPSDSLSMSSRGSNQENWNILAIIETIFANIFSLLLCFYFENFYILYASLIFAPLLLLKSREADAAILNWYRRGIFSDVEILNAHENRFISRNINIFFRFFLGFIIGLIFYWYFFGKIAAPDAFLLGMAWGLLNSFISASIAAALTLLARGSHGSVDGAAAAKASIFSTGIVATISSVVAVGWIFGIAVCLACVMVFITAATATRLSKLGIAVGSPPTVVAQALQGVRIPIILGVFFIFPYAVAVVAFCLLLRIAGVIKFFPAGYSEVPANLRNLAVATPPSKFPELLPSLPDEHPLRFRNWIMSAKSAVKAEDAKSKIAGFFSFVVLIFWFFPGFIYRFSLKSTLWLWWILFFLAGTPKIG